MDRRDFLLSSSTGLAALSIPAVVSAAIGDKLLFPEVEKFTQQDWLTLATVQNHLFPSEEHAPGALEINALHYLHNFLGNPATDPVDIQFILSGTHSLQQFAKQNHSIPFAQLAIDEREKLLRKFEQQPEGRRWLTNILNYILESLLTDPVYGGNPEQIGWKWLEHRAGEPRPPANKRYWLL